MSKKLLLLWSPLADYSVASLQKLAQKSDLEICLVYQPAESDAPYKHLDTSFCAKVFSYAKENEASIEEYCNNMRPDIILMASWNYPLYMRIARRAKSRGTYVVSMFDRQWLGSPKQWLGIMTSKLFLKPSISNFFVSGDRQATFAHKLGYHNPYIGYNCANTSLYLNQKPGFKKNFIFVGRLVSVKGIAFLLKAYARYRTTTSDPWNLILSGKGYLEDSCRNQPGVHLAGFTQPQELPQRLAEASCLILPSLFEPWGLVVHEAAAAGISIIASNRVGAATYFVRDGQNGFIVNPDENSLYQAMCTMANTDAAKLATMSSVSKQLASEWTVEKWADYVYTYICLPQNQR